MTDVIYQINDGPKQLVENATSPLFVPLGETETIKAWVSRSKSYPAFDPDALAYIQRVEGPNGDNQPLEEGVRQAIDAFVVGAKADGIWDAIKASCILAGARTLDGALQPLVGPAPTNFNFVSGDYNRKTGLKGDGATKYLDSNRPGDADPLTDFHAAVWQAELAPSGFGPLIASRLPDDFANSSQIIDRQNNEDYQFLARDVVIEKSPRVANRLVALSLLGDTLTMRYADALDQETISAVDSVETTWQVLGRGNGQAHSNARLSFYSVGEALDLALLDARVTDLINAFGDTIP